MTDANFSSKKCQMLIERCKSTSNSNTICLVIARCPDQKNNTPTSCHRTPMPSPSPKIFNERPNLATGKASSSLAKTRAPHAHTPALPPVLLPPRSPPVSAMSHCSAAAIPVSSSVRRRRHYGDAGNRGQICRLGARAPSSAAAGRVSHPHC
jgi:hypothetical protein